MCIHDYRMVSRCPRGFRESLYHRCRSLGLDRAHSIRSDSHASRNGVSFRQVLGCDDDGLAGDWYPGRARACPGIKRKKEYDTTSYSFNGHAGAEAIDETTE